MVHPSLNVKFDTLGMIQTLTVLRDPDAKSLSERSHHVQ
jgi:hypothetical protein